MHTQPQLTLLVAHARFVSDLVKCARCNDTDERDFIASKLWVTTLFARAGALIEPINLAIASALLALVVQGVGQFWGFLETLQNLTAVFSTLAIQEISTKKSIVFFKGTFLCDASVLPLDESESTRAVQAADSPGRLFV